MTILHVIMVVCGTLAAALPSLLASFPPGWSPALRALVAIFALAATVLGAVSPSILPPKKP